MPKTRSVFASAALRAGALAALYAGAMITAEASAASFFTDVPSAADGNAQGPAPFRYYGTGGSRVQDVYAGALFSAGPQLITGFALRTYPGAVPNGLFGDTLNLSDVTVRLSTTTRSEDGPTPLSPVFADNIGADASTVYSGALSLRTQVPGTFDYRVGFQTPFLFDPSLGNLLLDVLVPVAATVSGTGIFGFATFDTVNTLSDGAAGVVSIFDGSATSGFIGTDAPVLRFFSTSLSSAAVPEPMTLSLFALGLAGLGIARHRSVAGPAL